jgi:carboxypeptidase Taq
LFASHLEKVIDYSKRYAQMIAPGKDSYDTLLDIYEEGATQEFYDSFLLPLQVPLTNILLSQQAQEDILSLNIQEYSKEKLE